MHRIRYTLSLILGTILILPTTAPPVVAQEQEAGHCPGRLEALDVSYRQQLREIERRWLGDLAEVADKSSDRGGERCLQAVIPPGDRARPLHRGKAGGPELLGVDPRGTRTSAPWPHLSRFSHGPRTASMSSRSPTWRHSSRNRVA